MDGIFAQIFNAIQLPVVDGVQAIIGGLSAWVAPILRWAIVVYVATRMIQLAYSPSQEPLGTFLKMLMKCAIAYWIVASAATYNQYLGTILLTTLPTEITRVVAGVGGHDAVTGALFDVLWGKAWDAGLVVYKNLPWTPSGVGLEVVVGLYWIAAIGSIAIGFLVFLAAQVILALLIALGVLFAAVFPFTSTRGYFDRWISACLSMVLLQVLVVALLAVLIAAENTVLGKIAGLNGTGGLNAANEVMQLKLLFSAGVLFFAAAVIAKQLPTVAVAVTGGVCADVGAFGAAVYGAAGMAGSAATGGAGAVASAAGTAASSGAKSAASFMRPAGPSLSG